MSSLSALVTHEEKSDQKADIIIGSLDATDELDDILDEKHEHSKAAGGDEEIIALDRNNFFDGISNKYYYLAFN